MLCRSAFKQNYPPEGFGKLVAAVVRHAGNLPLGLNVLGSYLRDRDEEYWMHLLPTLQSVLDGKIGNTLRVSYDGLDREEDKIIFRHIACLFNYVEVKDIKLLLADSNLGVSIGLTHLVDKSLIHIRGDHVVMHRLLQEMGRKIVRTQFIDKPGEREFLVDPNDICYVLSEGIDAQKVSGISLDTSEFDELHVHPSAFKRMRNLRFLEIVSKNFRKEGRLHLPESFDYLPPRLKLLCWPRYPMSCMPSNFRPENLVKLKMQNSKLHKLWEGVVPFTCLKEMDLEGSKYLKEIPDLSKATNLVKLDFGNCESLVELPSSIRNLNKLLTWDMSLCKSLKILPTGFSLKSLKHLDFRFCSELRTFPEFSTNISYLTLKKTNIEEFPSDLHLENLVTLEISKKESDGKQWEGVKPSFTPFLAMLSPTLKELRLDNIPSLVELPSSFQNLNQLDMLVIKNCRNLETLPSGINIRSLYCLCFYGCSRLRSFPEISTNISSLYLEETGIEEVPWRIEKFSNLKRLHMNGCSKLKCVSLNISILKHLREVDFSDCGALTRVDLSGYPIGVEMEADNFDTVSEETSFWLPDVNFMDCFNLDPETVLRQQSIFFKSIIMSGEEVPSYFTHRTTGSSSLTIPLLHVPFSQPFFRFRVGAVVVPNMYGAHNFRDEDGSCTKEMFGVGMKVNCEFKGRCGNSSFDVGFYFDVYPHYINNPERMRIVLTTADSRIPLNEDNAPLAQRNYDQVDMHITVTNYYRTDRTLELKGWGIRVLEECSLQENRLPHVCKLDEDNWLIRLSTVKGVLRQL